MGFQVTFGGTSGDSGNSLAIDPQGNIYSFGHIQGTVDFDPGANTANWTSSVGEQVAIAKYDPSGGLIWVTGIAGTGENGSSASAVDQDGNLYVTGFFSGTADFDTGPGVAQIASSSAFDAYVLKINGDGEYQWADRFTAANLDIGTGVSIDTDGDVYTTRWSASNWGTSDRGTFTTRLDSNGNEIWTNAVDGPHYDSIVHVDTDADGNVYTSGVFTGTVDFDPGGGVATLTSAGGRDAYLMKTDADGNFIWVRQFGGATDDHGGTFDLDTAGNIYMSGNFTGTADLDPGAGTAAVTSSGGEDVFVAKLDSDGGFIWGNQLGASGNVSTGGLAVDAAGNVYTTGSFAGTLDADPGAGVEAVVSAGGNDAYVSKLNADGEFVWVGQIGGTGADSATWVGVDDANTIYLTGSFQNTVDLDLGVDTAFHTSNGATDGFLVKFEQQQNSPPDAADDTAIVSENGSVTISGTALLANDQDPDPGSTLSIASIDLTGLQGRLVDNGDGTFTYDPDGQFEFLGVGAVAVDTFSYTITDGSGGTDTASVLITVEGENDAPVVADDTLTVDEQSPLTFTSASLLGNDFDPDSTDQLEFAGIDASGLQGQLVDNGDGTFTYDASAAFAWLAAGDVASETATYSITDGHGELSTGAVTFAVSGQGGTVDDETLVGTAQADVLDGGAGDDRIRGRGGDDLLIGGAGADTIHGNQGDDTLSGGSGDDVIHGGQGADRLLGGTGNDVLNGNHGTDSVVGGEGTDTLRGGHGADVLSGGDGDDDLHGGRDDDQLFGGGGHDVVAGGHGQDGVYGGAGNDTLRGHQGADTLSGGDGDDDLRGGQGGDLLLGDSGNDVLRGNQGDDTIVAGDGDDLAHGGQGADSLLLGDGSDTARGGQGDDTLSGGGGDDSLRGESGADWLDGGSGTDSVHGGAGSDILVYDAAENLAASDTYNGGQGSDTLVLRFTQDEWGNGLLRQEVVDFLSFLDTPGGRGRAAFQFEQIGLLVSDVEDLVVEVDGLIVDALAPSLVDDVFETQEDVALAGNVLANDVLPVAGGVTPFAGTTDQGGSVTIDAAGDFNYSPLADFSGSDGFDYSYVDADGRTATGSVVVTVAPVNDAPVAVDDIALVEGSVAAGLFSDSGQALNASNTQDVGLADLDGDGDLDIYVANRTGHADQVWLNDGSGQFSFTGQVLSGSSSHGVDLADLDGDGDVDVYIAKFFDPANQVWFNDGNGTLTDSGQRLGGRNSTTVRLADLDGDGDADAFVTNFSHAGNTVWINDGAGHFSDSGQSLGNSQSIGVELADLDNDGDLDAFVANGEANPNTVWLNDGNAGFTSNGQALGSGESKYVDLGDVDGDGDIDAFVVNQGQANRLYLNDGNGQFTDSGQAMGNGTSIEVALGDLDQDGDLDAYVANAGHDNRVWLNDGNGVFSDSGQSLGSSSSFAVSLGDVDGDSDLDAVTGNFNNEPERVWINGAAADGPHLILAVDLLANDFDVDGDTLAILSVGNGLNGTVALDGDANVLFTPDSGFSGQGSFTYTVTDGHGGVSNPATVLVQDSSQWNLL